MLKLLLIVVVLLLLLILIMGIRVFFTAHGKFPETRIGHNPQMYRRKIYCPQVLDKLERRKKKSKSKSG
jgi:uncharacterized protein YneF (UPF0154 family)